MSVWIKYNVSVATHSIPGCTQFLQVSTTVGSTLRRLEIILSLIISKSWGDPEVMAFLLQGNRKNIQKVLTTILSIILSKLGGQQQFSFWPQPSSVHPKIYLGFHGFVIFFVWRENKVVRFPCVPTRRGVTLQQCKKTTQQLSKCITRAATVYLLFNLNLKCSRPISDKADLELSLPSLLPSIKIEQCTKRGQD